MPNHQHKLNLFKKALWGYVVLGILLNVIAGFNTHWFKTVNLLFVSVVMSIYILLVAVPAVILVWPRKGYPWHYSILAYLLLPLINALLMLVLFFTMSVGQMRVPE